MRFAFENLRGSSQYYRDRFFQDFVNRQPLDTIYLSARHQILGNLRSTYDAMVNEDLVSHGLKEPAKKAELVEPDVVPVRKPTLIQAEPVEEVVVDMASLSGASPDVFLPNEEVVPAEDVLQPERSNIREVVIRDSFGYFQEKNGRLVDEEKRILVEKRVCVGLEPENGHFRIDFDEVIDRLEPAIADVFHVGRERLTGEGMAAHFMDNFPSRDIPLGIRDDGITATLGLAGVERHIMQEQDNWSSEGAILTAEASRNLPDDYLSTSPLEISIHLAGRKHYNRPPISDPRMIKRVEKVANRFADTFS